MSIKDDGGPAFPARPTEHLGNGMSITAHHGMSLRDFFIASALQGICASGPGVHMTLELIAEEACELADATIKARSKK